PVDTLVPYTTLFRSAKMWDVVENYNPWKTTPLTANHADLIGFTDAEIGATDKTTITAYKDFYDKTTYEWWKEVGGVPEYENAVLDRKSTSELQSREN